MPKPLPKRSWQDLLTLGKRKISRDGDMIGASKRKERNFKGM